MRTQHHGRLIAGEDLVVGEQANHHRHKGLIEDIVVIFDDRWRNRDDPERRVIPSVLDGSHLKALSGNVETEQLRLPLARIGDRPDDMTP